ncbi:IS200/IS605 family element transposase accessory protein TnpB [Candidatus Poribacteria bacterium]|nr:IS200/IS605 family element transposase accessory protein TnpB [Candidatus Poribacteria bacterium]
MVKAFKYRIYPKKFQQSILNQTLDECRWLYNHLLEQRKTEWEAHQHSLSCFEQQRAYTVLKQERPSLKTAHFQVLQNVAVRIDLAFKAFFRRVKNGEKPGYPRFRGKNRYDSMTYPQYGNGAKVNSDGSLFLSKIGCVKMVYHRPIEGIPKSVTIRRSATGKWYATIACEGEGNQLSENPNEVGIDVGLNHFAVLSNGEKIDNPRFFRTEEKELAKAQRKLSKAKEERNQRQYEHFKRIVATVHERIAFKRHNFTHQQSRKIVDSFGLIAVEDIHINRMVHNHCLAKSIHDAAWSGFLSALSYKAEYAGRKFVAVNLAYTSQNCSHCGHRQKMELSARVYRCSCCKTELDRDHNAALNILALGRQCLATA